MSPPEWRYWSWAILSGLPRPQEGPRFQALSASIKMNGVQTPILVDENGIVWDGRSRHAVCLVLDIEPPFQVVKDGPAAARAALVHRQLSILEKADLLAYLRENNRENFSQFPGERESEKFSAWLRDELGWESGFSWKNLDGYHRLANASKDQREHVRLVNPHSLNQALRLIASAKPIHLPRPDVDGPEQIRVIEQGSAFLNALESCVIISAAVESLLLQAQKIITRALRTQQNQKNKPS